MREGNMADVGGSEGVAGGVEVTKRNSGDAREQCDMMAWNGAGASVGFDR